MSKTRLESFSDGLMAIVITLLAFDLAIPVKNTLNEVETLRGIFSMGSEFLLFFISFITLSTMWINHHYIISKIDEIRARVLWTNSTLLMFITLVPFATNFLAKNPYNKISLMFYAFLMFVISFMFSKLYEHTKGNELKSLFPKTKKVKHIGMISYFIAFLITPFFPLLGYVFLCIPILVYILPRG